MNPDISPLLRPQDIKEPGLYRYRRDSCDPWGFAVVVLRQDGELQFQPTDSGITISSGWHSCSDGERGQFAPGPIDPVPPVAVDERQAFEKWAYSEEFDISEEPFYDGTKRSYIENETERLWWAWQARAALPHSSPTPSVTVSAEDARLREALNGILNCVGSDSSNRDALAEIERRVKSILVTLGEHP